MNKFKSNLKYQEVYQSVEVNIYCYMKTQDRQFQDIFDTTETPQK